MSEDQERVRAPVDAFRPPWPSFAAVLAVRRDDSAVFLTEVDHEAGTRTSWTARAWRAHVLATAAWLRERGVGPGDAVATHAGNSAAALAVAYACWVLGACVVPLNPGDPAERHRLVVADCRARLLVRSEGVPAVPGPLDCTIAELPGRTDAEDDVVAEPPEAPGGDRPPDLEVPALRVYTSGTTGAPKGVVLTMANLLTDADALQDRLDWPGDTRVLTVLPVHHVNGLVISSLLPWVAGWSTVLCDRFRSQTFWDDVAAEGATACSVVPSLLEFLVRTPVARPRQFRELLCGAGPLLVETALSAERVLGVPVRHLYGLSETTAVATLVPSLPDRARTSWHRDLGFPSIGPALPHVAVTVLDDEGRPVPPGVRGEIAVRGAVVMQGYADRPDETAQAFRGGWFHSGDEGFFVEADDGVPWFFVTGRMKELIIRGGANISPLEIDAVLNAHPRVRHALAVPFDNRFYGEEVAAYVVAEGDVTADDVLAHCAQHLDAARCPKVVVFGDELPYTATGKPKRLELRRLLADQLEPYREVQFRRSGASPPDTGRRQG